MHEFLNDFRQTLNRVCATFLQVPPETYYPYITLEPDLILKGLPWGPTMVTLNVKIWSRYAGTHEIVMFSRRVEQLILTYAPKTLKVSLKILKSTLVLLNDGQTRVHTFHLKVRIAGES